jgi:hypothetical protein
MPAPRGRPPKCFRLMADKAIRDDIESLTGRRPPVSRERESRDRGFGLPRLRKDALRQPKHAQAAVDGETRALQDCL